MIEVNRDGDVWVFAQQHNGKLNDVSLELLSKGRELADQLKVPLGAALLGKDVEPLAKSKSRMQVRAPEKSRGVVSGLLE